MISFFSRFYFLSKLTTSLILLILLFFLSYFFIKAFLKEDNFNNSHLKTEELSHQIFNLAKSVESNSENLNIVKNLIEENKQSVEDIGIILEDLNDNRVNNNLFLKIDKLSAENKKLADELFNILTTINNIDNIHPSIPQSKSSSLPVNNIIELIRLKLNIGLNFNEEVDLLKNFEINAQYESNVEKLSIYAIESFSGLDKLNFSFDQISSSFLNDYYLNKNNNNFIKHFFNLVSFQPNLSKDIEDETVLLLSLAKQYLLDKNLDESIKQLNNLDEGEYYFSNWIKQATYYDRVINLLNNF